MLTLENNKGFQLVTSASASRCFKNVLKNKMKKLEQNKRRFIVRRKIICKNRKEII